MVVALWLQEEEKKIRDIFPGHFSICWTLQKRNSSVLLFHKPLVLLHERWGWQGFSEFPRVRVGKVHPPGPWPSTLSWVGFACHQRFFILKIWPEKRVSEKVIWFVIAWVLEEKDVSFGYWIWSDSELISPRSLGFPDLSDPSDCPPGIRLLPTQAQTLALAPRGCMFLTNWLILPESLQFHYNVKLGGPQLPSFWNELVSGLTSGTCVSHRFFSGTLLIPVGNFSEVPASSVEHRWSPRLEKVWGTPKFWRVQNEGFSLEWMLSTATDEL